VREKNKKREGGDEKGGERGEGEEERERVTLGSCAEVDR